MAASLLGNNNALVNIQRPFLKCMVSRDNGFYLAIEFPQIILYVIYGFGILSTR